MKKRHWFLGIVVVVALALAISLAGRPRPAARATVKWVPAPTSRSAEGPTAASEAPTETTEAVEMAEPWIEAFRAGLSDVQDACGMDTQWIGCSGDQCAVIDPGRNESWTRRARRRPGLVVDRFSVIFGLVERLDTACRRAEREAYANTWSPQLKGGLSAEVMGQIAVCLVRTRPGVEPDPQAIADLCNAMSRNFPAVDEDVWIPEWR